MPKPLSLYMTPPRIHTNLHIYTLNSNLSQYQSQNQRERDTRKSVAIVPDWCNSDRNYYTNHSRAVTIRLSVRVS